MVPVLDTYSFLGRMEVADTMSALESDGAIVESRAVLKPVTMFTGSEDGIMMTEENWLLL